MIVQLSGRKNTKENSAERKKQNKKQKEKSHSFISKINAKSTARVVGIGAVTTKTITVAITYSSRGIAEVAHQEKTAPKRS